MTIKLDRIAQEDIKKIAALGIRSVRTNINWSQVEREEGEYEWDLQMPRDRNAVDYSTKHTISYDDLIDSLRQESLHVLIALSDGNPLYTGPLVSARFGNSSYLIPAAPRTPDSIDAFASFAAATAAHYTELYGNEAFTWAIWNEPDFDSSFPPKTDGAIVGRLVEQTCRKIKEASPDAQVMAPSLSVNSDGSFHYDFIKSLFDQANPLACLDAFTLHPYRPEPPETAPADYARMAGFISRWQPDKKVPIAVDEWGASTTPPAQRQEDVAWRSFTQEEQAALFLRMYLVNLSANVPYTSLYEWQDSGAHPDDAEENYGMTTRSGKEKPTIQMLRYIWPRLSGRILFKDVSASHCGPNAHFLRFAEATGQNPDIVVAWTERPVEGLELLAHTEKAADAFGNEFSTPSANTIAYIPLGTVPVLLEMPTNKKRALKCKNTAKQ